MSRRSTINIAAAGGSMFLVFALLSNLDLALVLPYAGALATYVLFRAVSKEITRQDFAAFLPNMKITSSEMSRG
jgi:hypothetical protein